MNLFAEFDENYPNLAFIKTMQRVTGITVDQTEQTVTGIAIEQTVTGIEKKIIFFLKIFRFFTFKTILII